MSHFRGITSLSHENCDDCECHIMALITAALAAEYFQFFFLSLLFAETIMKKWPKTVKSLCLSKFLSKCVSSDLWGPGAVHAYNS